MSEELVHREAMPVVGIVEMDVDQYERMKGIATMFAQAGIFKDVNAAPVAFAKMVIGRELGLGIPQSMTGIHLIPGGGIQMHYSTILQCVRANGFDYRIVENSAEKCVIKWFRGDADDGHEIGETTFTMEMAKRAEFGKKSGMYDKVPENMLLARAVSNGAKAHVPAAFRGMPVYVAGEVPAGELTEGEGTGEARGIELPGSVLAVIERAEQLGHQGWAERAVWEYRSDRGVEVLEKAVLEANEELNDLAQSRVNDAIADAEVVPDRNVELPVDDADLPEPTKATFPVVDLKQPLSQPEEVPEEVPEEEETLPIVEHEPEQVPDVPSDVDPPKPAEAEVNVEALRRRLAILQKKKATSDVEKELKDEEIAWIEGELMKAAEQEADEDPSQGSLL